MAPGLSPSTSYPGISLLHTSLSRAILFDLLSTLLGYALKGPVHPVVELVCASLAVNFLISFWIVCTLP